MHCSFRKRARRALAALAGAAAILIITNSPSSAQATWASGVRNNDATLQFAGWRGTTLRVVTGWIEWKQGWAGMNAYASGTQPRALRTKSANVSFGHGLFPQGATSPPVPTAGMTAHSARLRAGSLPTVPGMPRSGWAGRPRATGSRGRPQASPPRSGRAASPTSPER